MTTLIDLESELKINCDRKKGYMIPVSSSDFKEYVVWLIAIVVVAFGFRHAREMIAFVLDKLYQVFIQNNPAA